MPFNTTGIVPKRFPFFGKPFHAYRSVRGRLVPARLRLAAFVGQDLSWKAGVCGLSPGQVLAYPDRTCQFMMVEVLCYRSYSTNSGSPGFQVLS